MHERLIGCHQSMQFTDCLCILLPGYMVRFGCERYLLCWWLKNTALILELNYTVFIEKVFSRVREF